MPLLSALASLACSTIARWFLRSLVVAQTLQLSSSSWPCPLAGVASGGILVQQRRRCSFIVESWLNNHGSLEEKRCFSTPLPLSGTWGHRPGVGPVEPAAWVREKIFKVQSTGQNTMAPSKAGAGFFFWIFWLVFHSFLFGAGARLLQHTTQFKVQSGPI